MKILRKISDWFFAMGRCFAREWHICLHDMGVLLFFVMLPLMYPIAYTLIYNPEVVRKMPVAIVDHDRTFDSRKLVRDVSASPTMEVYDYVPDMSAAKDLMARGDVFAILEIPRNYGKKIGRMETAHATLYTQMSLLLRYRGFASAITDVQLKDIAEITGERAALLGQAGAQLNGKPIENNAHMLGDIEQGFASFVMPGILILILQQSMILGICMLTGTSRERRRKNRGIDPLLVQNVPATALIWGRTFCYTTFFAAAAIWLLHWVPEIFSLPHFGSAKDWMLFILPFIISTAFFGQTLSYFVHDRESSFIVIAFTSVIFLFLSGLTWPMYAMPDLWVEIGKLIPSTWAVPGFIRINSNAATLADNFTPYIWLWILSAVYFIASWIVIRRIERREGPRAYVN